MQEYYRDDVMSALQTMQEGDDVDFEPLEEDDPIWERIGFDPTGDDEVEDFVQSLDQDELSRVIDILIQEGHLY